MSNMNIVFLFSDNFPGSSAYSNRIHSLAKGLVHHGNDVEVSVVYPGNWSNGNEIAGKQGLFEQVNFKYYCLSKFKPNNRILQILDGVWGIIHFFFHWLLKVGNKKPDFIIACSSSLLHLSSLYILSKLKGIKILREYNEYPLFIQRKKKYLAKIARYRLLDGFIFMTKRLEEFFKEELKMYQKSVIVNMTVDTDRFKTDKKNNNSNSNYITLVGDILGEKDGVGILIKSFKLIHESHPEIKLQLVGNISDNKAFKSRQDEINKLGLTDYIDFTGLISRDKIPDIMVNSKLLLLPRPSSFQSESGFPTKLGEYLSSETPTAITKTGEIENFLTDSETAFLVEPDNIISFAERVIYALDNYNLAIKVGIKGKKVVDNNFSHISQAKVLNDFLLNFNS